MSVYFSALFFGFLIALPIGASEILILKRTITHGRLSGIISALGASMADLTIAVIIIFGLNSLSFWWMTHNKILSIISNTILVIIGLFIFRYIPQISVNIQKKRNYLFDFLTTYLVILTNPLTIIIFTTILPNYGLIDHTSSIPKNLSIILMIMIGEMSWRTTSIAVINILGKKLNENLIHTINKTVGIIIFAIGSINILSTIL